MDWIDEHLSWQPITLEHMGELQDLRRQIEELDNTVISAFEPIVDLAAMQQFRNQAMGGWDQYGNLLAYGLNISVDWEGEPRTLLSGGVHPSHRYQGIGSAILQWQQERAIAWRDATHPGKPLWLGCYCESSQPSLERVLRRFGFEVSRLYCDVFRDLTQLPDVAPVPGVEFWPWDDVYSEDVRHLHNRCFAESRLARIDPASWRASFDGDAFRPQWSWVATADDRVVGYALAREDSGDDGLSSWTDRLGVHPDYRGQGISTGLLVRGFHAMKTDGCVRAGLGVDTSDRRFLDHLETNLGYQIGDSVALMSRVVTG